MGEMDVFKINDDCMKASFHHLMLPVFYLLCNIVVKTRLQTINKAHGEKTYKGIVDCLMYVFQIYFIYLYFIYSS